MARKKVAGPARKVIKPKEFKMTHLPPDPYAKVKAEKERIGARKKPEYDRTRDLPTPDKLTTDDLRKVFVNIPLAIAAIAGAYGAAKKIENALKKRTVSGNISDLAVDAKHQLNRALDAIEDTISDRHKILFGRRRREPYSRWGKYEKYGK